ncbi:unnamed protein product [Cochlearia groenlandica]
MTYNFKILDGSEHMDYLLVLVGVASVVFLFLYAKPKRPSPPLPPGPWGLPILGNLPFLGPELHTYFQSLSLKHGPIFKLWLGAKLTIVVSSSEVAHEILKTNDAVFANRQVPAVAPAITYGGTDIVWTPYGPKWRLLRKLCANRVLCNPMLDSTFELRRLEAMGTIRFLADKARAGSPVNIGEEITRMILNVVTQTLWGSTIKGEEREIVDGAKFYEMVQEINDILSTHNISEFYPLLSRFDIQGLNKRMRALAQRTDHMFDRIIGQRLGMVRESEDFLDVLLKFVDAKDEKENLTMNDVKAVLVDMVLDGTESPINLIIFAMAELLNNVDVMKRAQEELDNVVGKDKIVEESHVPKLPYLLAIVKETLRLHLVAAFLANHSPSQDTVVGGFTIPKDTKVIINAWAIHRDPKFWKNPLEFNPNRFLDKSYGFSGNDLNFIPFGSGRRICVGIAMAERISIYNLAVLLHSFDWKLPQGKRVEIVETFGAVLKLKDPLFVTPVIRLSDPKIYI